MKKILLIQVVFLLLIVTTAAQPKRIGLNNESNQVISLKSAEVLALFDVATTNARRFDLNPALRNNEGVALGDTLVLALFPGKEYPSVVQSREIDVNGTTVIMAKLTGFKFAYCCISITEKAALVTVDIPELKEKYTTRFQPNKSTQYLVQLDENKLDVLKDGHVSIQSYDSLAQSYLPKELQHTIPNEKTTNPNKVGLKSAQVNATINDSAQIDILVVYTPAAKEWADTYEGGINNAISQTMAKCNLVSGNSKLGIRFNMVHSTVVDFTESGNTSSDLYDFIEGTIPNVRNIRDLVGADLVILITKTDDFGGMSWPLNDKNGTEEYGFLISRVQELSGFNTIHEIGHILGAHHPKEQFAEPGPTVWSNWPENTWSAGWRWKGDDNNNYCDVMSYEDGWYFADGISNTRVPYFSDPDIRFQGQPTGHATEANNARTIRETKQVVAAYRKAKPKNTQIVYTLNVHDITKTGVLSGGYVTNEGESPVSAKGIVWSTIRNPTLNDHFTADGSGLGSFNSQMVGLYLDSIYYVRAYATNAAGTVYGNQIVFLYTGDIEEDFITRWELPEGQEKLELILGCKGEVSYKWETVPAGHSGSGKFTKGFGLVQINNLPAGHTIRVSIKPNNLTRFCSFIARCPIVESPDKEKIVDIEQWGTFHWSNMNHAFYGCKNLKISATDIPHLNNVCDFDYMFYDCTVLNGPININKWPINSANSMAWMFSGARSFNQSLSDWDVSSVKNMRNMFYEAKNFNQDIGNWDVSSVTNMEAMFYEANSFNQNIGDWDVSSVTEMSSMFQKASSFNQKVGNWNVSSVIHMFRMFGFASAFNQDIGNWNVSKVKSLAGLFTDAITFNQDIGQWNVSSVTDMSGLFWGAKAFNQNLGGWDVSSVLDMSFVFAKAEAFNQDISSWDVSSVKYMNGMFMGASVYNQDIGNWNVSSVTDMSIMFEGTGAFNQNIGGWDVSSVLNMGEMFSNSRAFNQDIRIWDVSSVLKMEWMFQGAVFNKDVGSWDVSSVTNMSGMFMGARSFNWDLGKWNLTNVNNVQDMFNFSGIDCQNYSATLNAWSLNSNIPNNLTLGAEFLKYDCTAVDARSKLITEKGWTIVGDQLDSYLSQPEQISGETSLCQGQTSVAYTVPAIENATSYVWTLPNGAKGESTTNNIVVDFGDDAVSGYITVKGINACGESTESSLWVTINKKPIGAGLITGVPSVCQGQTSVAYTVPAIENATSYVWTLPNGAKGASTSNSIFVDFGDDAVSGNITVKGINTCGESAESSLWVTINKKPIGAELITGETSVCQSQTSVTYTVPAIENATSYVWTLPNGAKGASTSNSIFVVFGDDAVSGSIAVKGINACGESTESSLWVTINKKPIGTGLIIGETSICQGQTAVTYTVPANENATSYVWTLPNGANGTSTSNSIFVDFGDDAVSGNITAKGINTCGESAESSLWVTINKKPIGAGLITGETSICQGQTSVAYTVPAIENATLYVWTLPNGANGTSTTNNIDVDFGSEAVSGNIIVNGINPCGESTESSLSVTVIHTPPTPTISVTNNVLCSDVTEGNQWYCHDEEIENATTKEYVAKADGNYYVVVNMQGCTSAPSNVLNVTLVGTNDISIDGDLKLYPNPVSNQLTIECNGDRDKTDFEIINTLGQTVYRGSFVGKTTVETTGFAPGSYFVKIGTGKTFEFIKLVKN